MKKFDLAGMNYFELDIHSIHIKKASLVIRAINHGLRQHMLKLIHENGRISVTQIYNKLDLVQSVASQHLAILRKAALVNTERQAKHVFYSVNYQKLNEIYSLSSSLLKSIPLRTPQPL